MSAVVHGGPAKLPLESCGQSSRPRSEYVKSGQPTTRGRHVNSSRTRRTEAVQPDDKLEERSQQPVEVFTSRDSSVVPAKPSSQTEEYE